MRTFEMIFRTTTGEPPIAAVGGGVPHWPKRPSSVNWPSGSFRSTAAVQVTAFQEYRTAATGRLCEFDVAPVSR